MVQEFKGSKVVGRADATAQDLELLKLLEHLEPLNP